jgi:hypothetical protein
MVPLNGIRILTFEKLGAEELAQLRKDRIL